MLLAACRRRIEPKQKRRPESRPGRNTSSDPVDRGFFQDQKAGTLQMSDDTGRYGGHILIGLIYAPLAFKPQREGDRLGKVARIGRREVVIVMQSEDTDRENVSRTKWRLQNAPHLYIDDCAFVLAVHNLCGCGERKGRPESRSLAGTVDLASEIRS